MRLWDAGTRTVYAIWLEDYIYNVYFGLSGSWERCKVYFGQNGQWKESLTHVGVSGGWEAITLKKKKKEGTPDGVPSLKID